MNNNMHLSVIVPAFNEEINLYKNVNEFNKYLSYQNYDYEIIIVNDGSSDRTREIAEKLTSENNNIKLINNKINKGKGAAVKQGLIQSLGRYRLFIDADNATTINNVEKAWPYFNNGYDIVIGSRNSADASGAKQIIKQALWKRIFGIIGNKIIQLITIKGIKDTQCGFKIFTKKAVEEIIPKAKINRWSFDVEILAIAKLLKYKIAIIPVKWANSSSSRVNIRGYFYAFFEILKIKWNLIFKNYK